MANQIDTIQLKSNTLQELELLRFLQLFFNHSVINFNQSVINLLEVTTNLVHLDNM